MRTLANYKPKSLKFTKTSVVYLLVRFYMELPKDNISKGHIALLESAYKVFLTFFSDGSFNSALKHAENGDFTLLNEFFKNHPQYAPKEEVATKELGKEPQEA